MRKGAFAVAVLGVAAFVWSRSSNPHFPMQHDDMANKRVLVLGGTKGIGLGLAQHFASRGASVAIVGRTDPQVPSLSFLKVCPTLFLRQFAHLSLSLKADLSLVKEGARVTRDYLSSGGIDVLILSPGIATFQGYTPTAEGLDTKMALHYYSRVASALEAASALDASAGSCLFVLSGDIHSPYIPPEGESGLSEKDYSLKRAADAAGFFTDAAIQSLAKEHPRARFVHANPGFVASSWGTELPGPIRWLARGAQAAFARTTETCANYMAIALKGPPGAFIATQNGEIKNFQPELTEEVRNRLWADTIKTIKAHV